MEEEEFDKYVKLIMSMCTDYLMGGITKETFISNLKMISEQLNDSN